MNGNWMLKFFGLSTAMLLPLAGCSEPGGPARYEVSGEVTFDGSPVPGGRIMFAPDTSKNNSGPGSVAEIEDGRYRTRPSKGFVGGPCVATIYGTDGTVVTEQRDNSLFASYRTELDLPRANCRHDFVVPGPSPPTEP